MNNTPPPIRPQVCGHRGASGHAPENTLASFRLARQLGATWLEFDVQLSADGVPIILHDDTLERTTNLGRPARPTELSLAELKELDAGGWYSPAFQGEKLPTLDEVLSEFGPTMGLNIEIKSRPGFEADNGLERLIAEAVRRHELQERVLISSFDPFRLAALHQLDPALRLGALYTNRASDYPPNFDPFLLAEGVGAIALHPPFSLVNAELLERAHRQKLAVNTWTVNEPTDMRRLRELGVDMIITNYPDRLAEVLAA